MIDLSRIFHTGIIVEDLKKAMVELGDALGLEWTEVKEFDPIVHWIPGKGRNEIAMKAVYSRQGPVHLEVCEGPAGSFYDTSNQPDGRHIGVWVDDLVGETDRLVSAGWRILAANGTPDEGYGVIAYLTPPDETFVIELVDAELKPMIDEWTTG